MVHNGYVPRNYHRHSSCEMEMFFMRIFSINMDGSTRKKSKRPKIMATHEYELALR